MVVLKPADYEDAARDPNWITAMQCN